MNDSDSHRRIVFDDMHLANQLFGQQNKHLKRIERLLHVRLGSKGNTLVIEGDTDESILAERLLRELYNLLESGYPFYPSDIDYSIRILQASHKASLKDIFLDTVYVSARKKTITPKSLAQKKYIDAIRSSSGQGLLTVNVSIGIASCWLMARLGDFRSRHSDIELQLVTRDSNMDFSANESHVVVLFGENQLSGARVERLFFEEHVDIAIQL